MREEILTGQQWIDKITSLLEPSDEEKDEEVAVEDNGANKGGVDIEMYRGMFMTAFEMVKESGAFDDEETAGEADDTTEGNS